MVRVGIIGGAGYTGGEAIRILLNHPDGSEEMLTQAARKAAALERPPLFLHQSMPRLRLGMTVDAAVSTPDALNYLTRTADLKETLRRVCRWLRPGCSVRTGM